ncbi:hypothetical protein [Roseiflexus castenholzii]|uniref:hypothetical protein n=1 Tax=Roseiflexus castenholzii TaxID=120962 RepID=UPI003C7AEA4F
MCNKLTVLARDDASHTIAQCEQGTIHIFWVRAAIFLHPDDLLPLLALLQCWQPGHEATESDGFIIVRQANGLFQLWCNDAELRMSETELYGLAHLLWQVARRLDLLADDVSSRAQRGLTMYRRLTSVPERPECRN